MANAGCRLARIKLFSMVGRGRGERDERGMRRGEGWARPRQSTTMSVSVCLQGRVEPCTRNVVKCNQLSHAVSRRALWAMYPYAQRCVQGPYLV